MCSPPPHRRVAWPLRFCAPLFVHGLLLVSASALEPAAKATPTPEQAANAGALPTLKQLGPLQSSVTAWFSFDQRDRAGVGWSAEPLRVQMSKPVELLDTDRGKVARFTQAGSVMAFKPSLTLGPRYTLATWASFPIPKEHAGIFFHGLGGVILGMHGPGQFCGWVPEQKTVLYGEKDVRLTGWHHLAVSVDGKESKLYVDGQLHGTVPLVIAEDLTSVGNQPEAQHQHWMMVESMDDFFIFNRDLTEPEIGKLMKLHFASTVPPPPPATPKPAATSPRKLPPPFETPKPAPPPQRF